MAGTNVDALTTIDEYLGRSDWRVNANANQGYSLEMILNVAGKMIANYWLESATSLEASVAHRSGALHIHDLDMFSGYCAGWSLRRLLEEGFNGVQRNRVMPAKALLLSLRANRQLPGHPAE